MAEKSIGEDGPAELPNRSISTAQGEKVRHARKSAAKRRERRGRQDAQKRGGSAEAGEALRGKDDRDERCRRDAQKREVADPTREGPHLARCGPSARRGDGACRAG